MSIPVTHLTQDAVAALVDGELTCVAASRAARHLTGCAQCRMAVEAQREAKRALLDTADVAVPTDLLSRLRDIPFTAEGPAVGSTLAADGDVLTSSGAQGSWSVPLQPGAPALAPGQARWLRRGTIGMLAGLGVGVVVLAANLPTGVPWHAPVSVAGPDRASDRTDIVPPVVRTITVGSTDAAGGPP